MKHAFFRTLQLLPLGVSLWFHAALGDELKIGYFAAPPHVYLDPESHQTTGTFYHFLESEVFPHLEASFVWDSYITNVPRQLMYLADGTIDLAAVVSYVPDRAESFNYSKQPWAILPAGIVVKKSNSLQSIHEIDQLVNMRIGYTSLTYITPFMSDSRIHWSFIDSANPHEQNMKKLLAGRVDAVYSPDITSLLFYADQMGIADQLRFLPTPEPAIGVYLMFSPKIEPEIIDKINFLFEDLDIKSKYFDYLKQSLKISSFGETVYQAYKDSHQ